MRLAGVAARVWRMFQPCLRAMEMTERRQAKKTVANETHHRLAVTLPVKIGDKSLRRLDSWKEVRFGFRSAGFGFRSRRTLILFRLVLISFRRILNSFHGSWRLERSAAWTRFGVAAFPAAHRTEAK